LRVAYIIAEIVAVILIILGIYFILWGIDLLMPNKYAVVSGVASLAVGILIIGGGISIIRTLLLSLTIKKEETKS
jgi:hypothetical protein